MSKEIFNYPSGAPNPSNGAFDTTTPFATLLLLEAVSPRLTLLTHPDDSRYSCLFVRPRFYKLFFII